MKYKEELQKFLGQIKNTKLLAIIFIVGITLVLLPTGDKDKEKKVVFEETCTDTYKENTEKQLKKVLSGVKDAGKVEVMLVMDDDGDVLYAQDERSENSFNDEQNTKNYEKTYVLKNDAGGGESAIVVKRNMPKISGVLITSSGAGMKSVKNELVNAVKAVLGVRAHRIYVLEKK